MLVPSLSVFLFLVYLALLCLGPANGLPHGARHPKGGSDSRRKNIRAEPSKPVTVQTVSVTDSPNGPIMKNCKITLTPVKIGGKDVVQEVQECNVAVAPSGNGKVEGGSSNNGLPKGLQTTIAASGGSGASQSTSATTSQTSQTTFAKSASSTPVKSAPVSSTPVSTTASASSSTSASNTATATASPAVIVNGASSVSVPTTPASSATSSASATNTETPSANIITSAASSASPTSTPRTSAADSVSPAPPSASAASAAAAEGTSQVAFTMPGKKLSVLPIGLGVFAGISVIALIVVGLVTYERTKYRKAFRQRKLAEAGASMGYGGMAQRT